MAPTPPPVHRIDAPGIDAIEIADSLDAAVAAWDSGDRLRWANARFRDLVPALAAEVRPGLHFESWLYRAVDAGAVASARPDRNAWLRSWRAGRRDSGGAVREVELAPGAWFRVRESRLADGGILSCWTAVGELKRALAARDASEERWRVLAEAAADVAMVLDGRRVLFVNRRGAELFGADGPEALAGAELDSLLDPKGAAALDEALSGARGAVEVPFRALSGAPLPLEVRAAPLPDGARVLTLLVARDVFLAYHDALTRLPNRALFRDRLEQAMRQAERDGRKAAVLMLDLDGFKQVNDTLGHAAGDRLLAEVARRLRGCLRAADTVARFGGDEFAIVLPRVASADGAEALARRVAAALEAPVDVDGRPLRPSASIGATLFPDDAGDVDALLGNADLALYRAKAEAPRRPVEFYAEELGRREEERRTVADGLRRALAEDRLELHYQPQASLVDARPVGGEALLRWRHPERGLLLPGDFIEHAEATAGLIVDIGGWVIGRACAQLAEWTRRGVPPAPIWVNVSAKQFHDGALCDRVRASLEETGLDPRLLGLEITERALMPDAPDAMAVLDRLVEIGVELAIDDFGAGYASFNYLKRISVGKLKIDRLLVRGVAVHPPDLEIVRAIVQLGRNLGMTVLAEGVETEAQLAVLRDLGCHEVQGHLIGLPLPADEFARFAAAPA